MNEGRRSSGGIKGGLPVSSCRILLPPPAAAAPALGAAEEEVADTCVREDPWEAVLFRGRLMKGDAQIGDGPRIFPSQPGSGTHTFLSERGKI